MVEKLPPDAPHPRLCHVVKAFPEEEYGFNLHAERSKGQFIGKVDLGSPADQASLRQGDHIIAVNGVLIAGESHKQVVARIKQFPLETKLLVIDAAGKKWYEENNIPLNNLDLPHILCEAAGSPVARANGSMTPYDEEEEMRYTGGEMQASPEEEHVHPTNNGRVNAYNSLDYRSYSQSMEPEPLPRLCHLVKRHETDEFGFNLHAEKGKGHFIGKVDKDSLAERAGLEEGQRIVGVNGTLIYPSTPHKEVVQLVKIDRLRVDLLVASADVDEYYQCRTLPYSFDEVEDFAPSSVDVRRSQNGQPPSTRNPAQTDRALEPQVVSDVRSLAPVPVDQQKQSSPVFRHSSAPLNNEVLKRTDGPQKALTPQEFSRPSSSASSNIDQQIRPVHSPAKFDDNTRPSNNDRLSLPADMDSVFKLSASELRDRLTHRKKRDPKHDQLSMKEKYEIIRNL